MAEENISLDDMLEVLATGNILENYPEHLRGACCLLNGVSKNGRPLHIICTTATEKIIIITVYVPKQPKWTSPTQRRV
ncbi:MAG: DUF4258 domain-containing protein [Nitrospinae bacterium]|nr:DUF4258 domain-containing protein [Nitrospinota bacterium]